MVREAGRFSGGEVEAAGIEHSCTQCFLCPHNHIYLHADGGTAQDSPGLFGTHQPGTSGGFGSPAAVGDRPERPRLLYQRVPRAGPARRGGLTGVRWRMGLPVRRNVECHHGRIRLPVRGL